MQDIEYVAQLLKRITGLEKVKKRDIDSIGGDFRGKGFLKFLYIVIVLGMIVGFIVGCVSGALSNQMLLSDIKNPSYDCRSTYLAKGTCQFDGCQKDADVRLTFTILRAKPEMLEYDIPNKANFGYITESHVTSDKSVHKEKEDVYIVSNIGGGNYMVSKDEIVTTEIRESNHRKQYWGTFVGDYCSGHEKEAIGILADEMEAFFEKDPVHYLCITLWPYNLVIIVALAVVLYYVMQILPAEVIRRKAIRNKTVAYNKFYANSDLKDTLKSTLKNSVVTAALYALWIASKTFMKTSTVNLTIQVMVFAAALLFFGITILSLMDNFTHLARRWACRSHGE